METEITYTRQDETKGKRFAQVTQMLALLHEASPNPVPFDDLCEAIGAKYPQDIQAAVFALELTEVVDRYVFTVPGSTRGHVAYALRGADAPNPTQAVSTASHMSGRTSRPMGPRLRSRVES